MPAVNGVGEPCAGEPHARFEVAGTGNGADLAKVTGVAQPTGKPAATKAPGPKASEPPRQSPTLHPGCDGWVAVWCRYGVWLPGVRNPASSRLPGASPDQSPALPRLAGLAAGQSGPKGNAARHLRRSGTGHQGCLND